VFLQRHSPIAVMASEFVDWISSTFV